MWDDKESSSSASSSSSDMSRWRPAETAPRPISTPLLSPLWWVWNRWKSGKRGLSSDRLLPMVGKRPGPVKPGFGGRYGDPWLCCCCCWRLTPAGPNDCRPWGRNWGGDDEEEVVVEAQGAAAGSGRKGSSRPGWGRPRLRRVGPRDRSPRDFMVIERSRDSVLG